MNKPLINCNKIPLFKKIIHNKIQIRSNNNSSKKIRNNSKIKDFKFRNNSYNSRMKTL